MRLNDVINKVFFLKSLNSTNLNNVCLFLSKKTSFNNSFIVCLISKNVRYA